MIPDNESLKTALYWYVLHMMIGAGFEHPNKEFSYKNFIILSPVIGSLAISLLFFIGYRWRYYAEPYMIFIILLQHFF